MIARTAKNRDSYQFVWAFSFIGLGPDDLTFRSPFGLTILPNEIGGLTHP